MVSILSASLSPAERETANKIIASRKFSKADVQKQLASEIATLASRMKTGSTDEKFANATNIVEILYNTRKSDLDRFRVGTRNYSLRQAVGIMDQVSGLQRSYPSEGDSVSQKSHTPGPSSDLGNQPVKDQIPEPSDNETRMEYIKRLTDLGYSSAAAIEAANQRYGPTPATVGGTTTRSVYNEYGSKSKIVTKMPPKGTIKQASVPSWAIATNAAEPGEKITIDNGLRNASHYFPDAEYALTRRQIQREERRQESNRILSAKKKDETPAWYVVSNAWNEK